METLLVEGDDPMTIHKKMAETMDTVIEEIKAIQKNARENIIQNVRHGQ